MELSETIRKAIRESGKSRNKISVETGIDPAVLHRFVNGGGLKLETAETLLNYFSFEIKRKRGAK